MEIVVRNFLRTGQRKEEDNLPAWLKSLCQKMTEKDNFLGGIARLKDLANKSPEHLSRTFRKHLNVSPSAFVSDLKLNYAANLLARTDISITQVAFEAGFENLGYFYSNFRNKYQLTPKQFRKNNHISL